MKYGGHLGKSTDGDEDSPFVDEAELPKIDAKTFGEFSRFREGRGRRDGYGRNGYSRGGYGGRGYSGYNGRGGGAGGYGYGSPGQGRGVSNLTS
ncbi:protein decapping 5 [Raphanus sativus]|uniref:Protein decapping 5 n=1 Tax=Raphanus sativus TaxID=3726 RepID=A0A9W3DKS1_RAPSA|nr:protein decapping 5 [Raphanus sativus]XP_056864387.1 protein decapping 5 [Raphanus sativus]